MKIFRIIKLFFIYRKNILKNRLFLEKTFGLNLNLLLELWTVINLVDASEEMKQKFGKALAEIEIKKYINKFNSSLSKLELDELINIYEIKKIDNDNYGITFGYSLMNTKVLYLISLSIIITILTSIVIIII